MLIEWKIQSQIEKSILTSMQTAADFCTVCEGIKLPCSITVCLCDDETITEINRHYRSVARSTDVLSFPSVSYPSQMTAGHCEYLLKREFDDETCSCFLGDLFISVPHVIAQAKEYGHTVLREAVYLLVHGICHLMGYDHTDDHEKKRMREMEEKVLAEASARYKESFRSIDDTLLKMARDAMSLSYSPYSGFPVGAALHSTDGRIFLGCNIENASFGLTNCAERTALFKAVSEGATSFDVIAIAAKTKAWPCGACRQVLNEFAPALRVLVTWDQYTEEKNLNELLPEGFGPKSMQAEYTGEKK